MGRVYYTKIPHRIPVTIEYEMSAGERKLYELIEKYLNREIRAAFPDMDEHRLSLRMHRNFSSSAAALIKLLSEVEKRVEGEEQNEIIAMLKLAKNIKSDTKAVELVRTLKKTFPAIAKLGAAKKALIFTESREQARHKDDIQREFADTLARHKDTNEAIVTEAENSLFTSFTDEVAKSVMVTPKYIAEKIEQINADLWNITSKFLSQKGYIIDETTRTATLPADTEQFNLFYYWTGSRNAPYKGLRKYGANKNFKPASGRITLTSPIGRGVLHNIECCDNAQLIIHNAELGDVFTCEIGFYTVDVVGTGYVAFVGTQSGTGQNGQKFNQT